MSAVHEARGGFFQFPLCLLAQNLPFAALIDQCFRYAVCWYLDNGPDGVSWRKTSSQRTNALKYAASAIRFAASSPPEQFIACHTAGHTIVNNWMSAHLRKSPFVRFRTTDLFFQIRDRHILSERDWRVLAAVYSSLGNKPMVKLGWQSIQWRAAGLLTPVPLNRKSCGPIYPRGQIERSLKRLLDRGYLFGATYKRGERYWSNRLTHAQLWSEIKRRKLLRARAAQRRRLDTLSSAQISLELDRISDSPAISAKEEYTSDDHVPKHVPGHVSEHVAGHVNRNVRVET